MIDGLFGVLVQPWVPWMLAAMLATTALVAWLSFRFRRIAPVLAGLDRAIALVEASQGPSGFRRGFRATYQLLAEDPIVGTIWRAYALTIGVAPGTDEALGYSRRPHESFDDGLLVVAGVNLRLYRAVPNLLVGCGLLFTFVGLVGALYFGSRGIGAGDIAQAQHALHELLAAATFKFATSIAGLGSSLVYSWREKALLYRVQYRLARFCTALEERMVPITTASIVVRQLGELKAQQMELWLQCGQLDPSGADQMSTCLSLELGKAVAPLRETLAAAADRLGAVDQWIRDAILQTVGSQVRQVSVGTDMISRPSGPDAEGSVVQPTQRRGWLAAALRRLRAKAPHYGRGGRSSGQPGSVPVPPSAVSPGDTCARAATIGAGLGMVERG